ncbi:DUF1758 domain-containing protein [Trichonephila clavata]|uniref:DUF1758 domain-containing protein n=1 Tax=Trichonephila clavata TaxID=2740835 RepID=A0A8X6G0M0_TRICU|nr:DUF1758 domain-containing protein [Trichonephila clavata]
MRYLPHRAVFKESSLTTKIRPVFDASAKDENSISLNQCLATGPNYIERIPSILNKFRKNGLGVISDIRKAFLQISISPTDRDYLRFLWWENYEKREIKIYRHCRVVFGLSSSPFLLMATIYHHLEKERNDVAVKLKDSFYVDNVVASVQNEIELQRFQTIACQVMSKAGFELTGNLSEKELSKSELEILLFIQKETFGKNRRLIIPNFVVYLDSDGLLRVETKLFSTDTGDYFRRPILLPDKHELVLRLIEETHRIHNHADQTEFCVQDLDLNDMQNLRKRAKHLHAVKHKLKTRFQKEYISLLKQTSNKVQTPLSVGDIVLISLDNKKRVDWPLAKIVEIYKGVTVFPALQD